MRSELDRPLTPFEWQTLVDDLARRFVALNFMLAREKAEECLRQVGLGPGLKPLPFERRDEEITITVTFRYAVNCLNEILGMLRRPDDEDPPAEAAPEAGALVEFRGPRLIEIAKEG